MQTAERDAFSAAAAAAAMLLHRQASPSSALLLGRSPLAAAGVRAGPLALQQQKVRSRFSLVFPHAAPSQLSPCCLCPLLIAARSDARTTWSSSGLLDDREYRQAHEGPRQYTRTGCEGSHTHSFGFSFLCLWYAGSFEAGQVR